MPSAPNSSAGGEPHHLTVLSDLLDLRRTQLDSDAHALGDGVESMSYSEYARAVEQLAGALIDLGVAPRDRVGVHLQKSVASFVAVHAVLHAGAVMVPLDAFAPVDHTASVVVDAGIEVLITDARQATFDRLSTCELKGVIARSNVAATTVSVVTWDDALSGAAVAAVAVDADDPAYIIYTSGSTGRPKGIVHTHRSALAYARLAAAAYELRAEDHLANVASLHFDQSTFELYVAPLVGCAVTVVPDAVMRFPASLSELIEREQITVWYSVPYILRQMVARGALDSRDLRSIRWVLYGGESYPPEELAELMEAMPNAVVSNVYGPAEVNQCTRFDLACAPPVGRPVPIGRAWAETELVVVDADGVPTSSGSGELLVSSTTMMERYWNRPDLTAAAIIDATFDGRVGTRWYRTGDLVEANADGDLVFLGRADNQVKIRGQRVELEAVDLTVRQLDGVSEVAVVAAVRNGDLSLIAVVEPDVGDSVSLRDVQRKVASQHPRGAVPVDLVLVDRLARTATGKVDRNAALAQTEIP